MRALSSLGKNLIRPIDPRQPPLKAGEALLDVRGPPGPGPVRRAGRIAESQRRGLPEAQGRERARGPRGRVNYLATPPTNLHHDGA